LQGGSVVSVVVGLYDDLHVLIEGDEEAQRGRSTENWRKSPRSSLETSGWQTPDRASPSICFRRGLKLG